MQTYATPLQPDEKMARAIERRKALEAERKKRIFDPRVRSIGVDKTALDAQAEEKRQLAAEELYRNHVQDQTLIYFDREREAISRECERQRRQMHQELNEYRDAYQQFTTRREFDLNNPNRFKKDLPARIDDEDPRCGVSSLQKFSGEDLTARDRAKMQSQQMRNWSNQQVTEKLERRREEEELERRHAAHQKILNEYANAIADEQRVEKEEVNRRVRDVNLRAAYADKEKLRQDKVENYRTDLDVITYHMNSDLLTENPDLAKSRLGPHRINPMQFKGLRPDQHQQILADQQRQREELESRRSRERAEAEAWAKSQQSIIRSIQLQENEFNRQKRERNQQEAMHLQVLAAEQKEKNAYHNKVLYKNRVDDAFFEQFQTSTR